MKPYALRLWCLLPLLLAACGDEAEPVRRGCTPEHDASGTYRFSHAYLDQRLRLLEESLQVEKRPYDRAELTSFVERMRQAWVDARLVLRPNGTFTLTGVAHPELRSVLEGTWEVRLDCRECKLHLMGGDETLRALLGEGWVIPWLEEPQPGVILDIQLVTGSTGSEVR